MNYVQANIPLPYRITGNDNLMDSPYAVPYDAQKEMIEIYEKLQTRKKPKELIHQIEKLIQLYPELPPLYNYLSSAYCFLIYKKSFGNGSISPAFVGKQHCFKSVSIPAVLFSFMLMS